MSSSFCFASKAGQRFREQMYPMGRDDMGLLRLHSTYRHDLKLYSSDEGRVRKVAVERGSSLFYSHQSLSCRL